MKIGITNMPGQPASAHFEKKLREGARRWNTFRDMTVEVNPVLVGAKLGELDLRGANLDGVDFRTADLSDCRLDGASLVKTDLRGACLKRVQLMRAQCIQTSLAGASLERSDLTSTTFVDVTFSDVNFNDALLAGTVFVNCDLSSAYQLGRCDHRGPSSLDAQTLLRSGDLAVSFLRGCGLPDQWIEYLPSLRGSAIQLYSCFISYSTADLKFVRRLHADLQDRGIRCWFAPEDFRAGDKLLDTIHQAIRLRDKLLVVMSAASIESGWVEDEVTKAFSEERSRSDGSTVLVPISVDDAFLNTEKAWAVKIREQRFVQDFSNWDRLSAYETAIDRLMPVFKPEAKTAT